MEEIESLNHSSKEEGLHGLSSSNEWTNSPLQNRHCGAKGHEEEAKVTKVELEKRQSATTSMDWSSPGRMWKHFQRTWRCGIAVLPDVTWLWGRTEGLRWGQVQNSLSRQMEITLWWWGQHIDRCALALFRFHWNGSALLLYNWLSFFQLCRVWLGTQMCTLEIIGADLLIDWMPFLLATNRVEGSLLKANLMSWIQWIMLHFRVRIIWGCC